MSQFNVSFIVWAKSQDSVDKPQFLKRKESRSGSNQGPSASQPSALPLGHTGSQAAVAFTLYKEAVTTLGVDKEEKQIGDSSPEVVLHYYTEERVDKEEE